MKLKKKHQKKVTKLMGLKQSLQDHIQQYEENLTEEGFRRVKELQAIVQSHGDHPGEPFFPRLMNGLQDSTVEALAKVVWFHEDKPPVIDTPEKKEDVKLFNGLVLSILKAEGTPFKRLVDIAETPFLMMGFNSAVAYWFIVEHCRRNGLIEAEIPETPFSGTHNLKFTGRVDEDTHRDIWDVLCFHQKTIQLLNEACTGASKT